MIAGRAPEDGGAWEAILDHAEGWRHCGQTRPVGFGGGLSGILEYSPFAVTS